MKTGFTTFQLVEASGAKRVDAAEVKMTPAFVMDALDSLAPENGREADSMARVGRYTVLQPDTGA